MPEGPEVKRWTESLDAKASGKIIKLSNVSSGRYMRADPTTLGLHRLEGMKVERVSCKGKLIVFHLRRGEEIHAALSTLGMTGWWDASNEQNDAFDKYKRISIEFEDGSIVSFFDPRNFGTFKIVSYNEMKRKLAELGPDILTPKNLWSVVTLPEFFARVKRFGKNQDLAEGLLDQRIASGCGNYIRADAMYLAKLSPHRPMSELSEQELHDIWNSMWLIGTAAYNNWSVQELIETGERVPAFENLCYNRAKSLVNDSPIESYSDKNDRTVWWCPSEQT